MVAVPTTERSPQRKPSNGRSRSFAGPGDGGAYPLSDEVLEQLQRQHIEAQGLRVYSNRLRNERECYRGLHRWARAQGGSKVVATYRQLATTLGVSQQTVYNMLERFEEMGLVSRRKLRHEASRGEKIRGGMTRCLEITLLPTRGPKVAPELERSLRSIIHVM